MEKTKITSWFFDKGYEIKNSIDNAINAGNLHIKNLVSTDHALYFYKRKTTTMLECPNYRLKVYGKVVI